MQFTINCPNDGEVVVNMSSVENMVIRDKNTADITFQCPICGTHVTMTAPVPAFLMSTMENLSRDLGIPLEDGKILFNTIIGGPIDDDLKSAIEQGTLAPEELVREISQRHESTVEEIKPRELDESDKAHIDYFHHQLADISTVDELLSQLDD